MTVSADRTHGVITAEEVIDSLQQLAAVVDEQNADDSAYEPMVPSLDGPAYLAARALIVEAADQPSGYTEPILHRFRAQRKRLAAGRRS